MRVRLVIGGLGATLALSGLTAAHAWACAEPKLSTGGTFGPGDTVGYSISGIEPGASYTLTAPDGSVLDSGTASGPFSGSFTMPDLGSEPATMNVHMVADHNTAGTSHPDGAARYTSDATVDYQPPAPPPPPPGDDPPAEQPNGTNNSAATGSAANEAGGGREPDQAVSERSAPSAHPTGVAPQATPVAESSLGTPAASLNGRQAEARAGAASASRVAADDPTAEARTGTAIARPVDPPAVGDPAWFTGLVLLIAAPLAVAALLRRRAEETESVRAPLWIPPDLDDGARLRARLIEAELQEIVAEERARQILDREARDEPPHRSEERSRAANIA